MSNHPITRPSDPATPAPEGPAGFKGLTKRKDFAKAAMQGLLAYSGEDYFSSVQALADTAVVYADALIDALNKQ